MISYGPSDATLTPVKSRMVYLAGADIPGSSGKMPLNGCSSRAVGYLFWCCINFYHLLPSAEHVVSGAIPVRPGFLSANS